jgi:aspartate carbamoyltransferase catalytic subunit
MSLLTGSHILSSAQFSRSDLEQIFALAEQMEPIAQRQVRCNVLDGAVLANLFFEPSTRSRISFGAAFARLGGRVLDTTGVQNSSISKGESLRDTSRVIAGYVDVIVLRHPEIGAAHDFASSTSVPVINGGDGAGEHPTQALLDVYTMGKELRGRKVRSLDGSIVTVVGDLKHGRTVHSLIRLLSLYDGITIRLVSSADLRLPPDLLAQMIEQGVKVIETDSLESGLRGADVVYATRMQLERFDPSGGAAFPASNFNIDAAVVQRWCVPDVVIMHPLPRDSRASANELSMDLDGHPSLAIFRQAHNGVPIRMALFAMILGVAERVQETLEPVGWYVPPSLMR